MASGNLGNSFGPWRRRRLKPRLGLGFQLEHEHHRDRRPPPRLVPLPLPLPPLPLPPRPFSRPSHPLTRPESRRLRIPSVHRHQPPERPRVHHQLVTSPVLSSWEVQRSDDGGLWRVHHINNVPISPSLFRTCSLISSPRTAATYSYISLPPPYTHAYSVGGPTREVHLLDDDKSKSAGALGPKIQEILFVPAHELPEAGNTRAALASPTYPSHSKASLSIIGVSSSCTDRTASSSPSPYIMRLSPCSGVIPSRYIPVISQRACCGTWQAFPPLAAQTRAMDRDTSRSIQTEKSCTVSPRLYVHTTHHANLMAYRLKRCSQHVRRIHHHTNIASVPRLPLAPPALSPARNA